MIVREAATLSPLPNSKNGGRGLCKNLCRLAAELAVYLHLGPYSPYIIASIERRLAALDAERVPAVAAEQHGFLIIIASPSPSGASELCFQRANNSAYIVANVTLLCIDLIRGIDSRMVNRMSGSI